MIRLHRFRPEDNWLFAISVIATMFTAVGLYSGTVFLRLLGVVFGFGGLLFVSYIIRRSYSRRRAQTYTLVCLVAAITLAYGVYLLTN